MIKLCKLIGCVFLVLSSVLSNTANGAEQQLPHISFPDLSGKQHALREWQGHKLLINFWATWCAPCRKEMPELVSLQSEFKQQNLIIVGIALDDRSQVRSYLRKNPVNYPVLLAPESGSMLSAELGNRMGVVPFSVFVDVDGVVEFTKMGMVNKDMVKDWIQGKHTGN